MIPFRLYLFILVGIAILGLAYLLLRRKPKTPDDLERERRAWLDRIGRITDGTVIDVQEMPGTRERPSTFLIYQYDVAGVSYEASQDVTYLRQFINLHSCRLAPTSVRFDPHTPETPSSSPSAGSVCGSSRTLICGCPSRAGLSSILCASLV